MFASATYADRRRALADTVPDGLIVLLGNDAAPMNYAANHYPFRQDGSFRYYAGADAAGLALLLGLIAIALMAVVEGGLAGRRRRPT